MDRRLPADISKEPARPNTTIHYPLFSPHSLPMPTGQLRETGWKQLTTQFPDHKVIRAILGICRYGAKIGYEGCRKTTTIHPNLSSANIDAALVTADLASELKKNRLEVYQDSGSLPQHYMASPLGLADKSDGSKRRIHHLSYPTGHESSINSGIPELYGAIQYSGIEDAITAVQLYGTNCILIKRDSEAAFRHIPISPEDSPLLGFHWQNRYYAERFLPFGLRTAPYLFNLFAEVFHWILEQQLNSRNIPATVIHYLDNFLIVLPPGVDNSRCTEVFSTLCEQVGLSIKVAKNEEGTTVSFAGIEFETSTMVIRLPPKKLHKARTLVQKATTSRSLSLLEIQQLTGYLNFVSKVVPLGRTFLRRLYNMELYFPPGSKHNWKRISSEAQRDLAWWSKALLHPPERSIANSRREVIRAWSDAASTQGFGGFYIRQNQTHPGPGSAFSIPIPLSLARGREHINTQEMRAVEQVLLHWGSEWKGMTLVIHVDNRAVAHAVSNRTIRGGSMNVLRRCLLLASEYDLDLEARWVSTRENALADALSRSQYDRIADLAPQLLQPTCNLQQRGFLTYNNRDCPK